MEVMWWILLLTTFSNAKETGDFVRGYGYPFESHKVTTEDGYILELHRIPHGKTEKSSKEVVFIQHGIMCSSMDWVFTIPSKSLAYMLADSGYDVWMGNNRGTKYSQGHVNMTAKDRKFWQFTWHEMGVYDLPAMIDKALQTTNQTQLYYIGHSQGTASYFVMNSLRPEYNSKIKLMSALSPVAYMSHLKSPILKTMANPLNIFRKTHLGNLMGYSEYRPNNSLQVKLTGRFCNSNIYIQKLCMDLIFMLTGFNWRNLNTSIIPMLYGHSSGASTKQVLHFVQEIQSGKFRQFDYGYIKNKRIYGSWTPPEYDLSKVTSPVALFYSVNDYLSSEKDVEILSRKLPNVVQKYLLPDDRFNHIDYMWGINASEILYPNVINLLQNF